MFSIVDTLRTGTVVGKDSSPGTVACLFVWTELRLRCMIVSHDGVWTGGAKTAMGDSWSKVWCPRATSRRMCVSLRAGVFYQHGMLGDRRAEARPGSGAGGKERGQAARSALEAAGGVV